MKDMLGKEVKVGDLLADDRGELFVALSTPQSYQKEGLIVVCQDRSEPKKTHLLRERFALKASERHLRTSKGVLISLWQTTYEQHVRKSQRQAIRERRQKFQEQKVPFHQRET